MDYIEWFYNRLTQLRIQKGVSARDMSLSLGQSESYINKIDSTSEYLYADQTYHGINYGNYDNVQAHAEPIYWLAGAKANNYSLDSDSSNRVEITDENETKTEYHHTYFVCEISWTETTKETDLFYIFAENADVQ